MAYLVLLGSAMIIVSIFNFLVFRSYPLKGRLVLIVLSSIIAFLGVAAKLFYGNIAAFLMMLLLSYFSILYIKEKFNQLFQSESQEKVSDKFIVEDQLEWKDSTPFVKREEQAHKKIELSSPSIPKTDVPYAVDHLNPISTVSDEKNLDGTTVQDNSLDNELLQKDRPLSLQQNGFEDEKAASSQAVQWPIEQLLPLLDDLFEGKDATDKDPGIVEEDEDVFPAREENNNNADSIVPDEHESRYEREGRSHREETSNRDMGIHDRNVVHSNQNNHVPVNTVHQSGEASHSRLDDILLEIEREHEA